VESVAWIAERKDVLSTFFLLLALRTYVAYVRRPASWRYLTTTALFAAGLMSKPMLVTFPFLLLLLDYWPLGRVPTSTWRRLVIEKLPLFALSAASCVVTFVAQSRGGAVMGTARSPMLERAANAMTSYVAYASKTFWPVDLAPLYPYDARSIRWWTAAAAGLALAAVTWLAVREAKRRPYFVVGWLWFVGTLVPVIGLV